MTYKKYLHSKEFFETPYYFYGINKNNILYNKNPEYLTNKEINNINELLLSDYNNLYYLESYIIYYSNIGNLNLDKYFKLYIQRYDNNPYILLRYSRYQASSIFKLYGKDKKYLYLALNNINKAISILESLHKQNEIPAFIYSWLWYIYMELWEYKKAINTFNKTIYINKKYHNHLQSEPYLWKATALNKIWKYSESLNLYLENMNLIELNNINDKRDFRFYKILSDNYYNLLYFDLFYSNLRLTIEFFLRDFDFHFNSNLVLNLDISILELTNIIEKNKYNSFRKYNRIHIKDNIDNIIFSIAFLYKEKLLWNIITFNDSRWIELLCYNYLQLCYEWKIK